MAEPQESTENKTFLHSKINAVIPEKL